MSQLCEEGHCVTSATAPAVADGTFIKVYQNKRTVNVEHSMCIDPLHLFTNIYCFKVT